MAKEATYLVIAPQGISSGVGLHPAGTVVGESDLNGEGTRLQGMGLVVRTATDAEPVTHRSYPGVPDWNDVPSTVVQPPAPEPPAPGDSLPEHAPENAPYRPPVTAEQFAAAAPATELHPDADAKAISAQAAPAVLRFVEQHPARLDDVLAAELHGKNRVSVVEALRAKAAESEGPTQPTGQHRPMPTNPPAGVKKTAAKKATATTRTRTRTKGRT
jgi:hypothetical protein